MEKDLKSQKIPEHVGLILDGNRRWAKERNLTALDGHEKGFEKMKVAPLWFFNRGVKTVSIYVFSTENWSRSREEVNHLMKLLKRAVDEGFKHLQGHYEKYDESSRLVKDKAEEFKKKYRVLFSGRLSDLPGDLPSACARLANETDQGKERALNVCLSYGGRAEIIDAVKKIAKNKIDPEQIHEGLIKKYLYNGGLSDPDIIVRTSGEQRISGFLLWQAAYSEFMFMKKYWPDFEEEDAQAVIDEYGRRQRRFGGDGEKIE